MKIMNVVENVKKQFSSDKNLAMRINFYKKYTTNKYNFSDWLFDKYIFRENMRILELGCGNASHWENKIESLPNGCSLILSDFSDGMINLIKQKFNDKKNIFIKKIDIQEIPFEILLLFDYFFSENSFSPALCRTRTPLIKSPCPRQLMPCSIQLTIALVES